MQTAKNTAEYILSYCLKHDIQDVNNKKLQKLLYYVYSWVLVYKDKKLFTEPLEAWLHGPVVPSVYQEYKHFGFKNIEFNKQDVKFDVTDDIKLLIDAVLEQYSKYDADYLEYLSHTETPWIKARKNQNNYDDVIKFSTIDDKDIKEYYKQAMVKEEKKEKQKQASSYVFHFV